MMPTQRLILGRYFRSAVIFHICLHTAWGLFDLPPRAWNSYDGFGTDFNEALLMQQASILSNISQAGGNFSYIVIDEGWACNGSTTNWVLDEYARPTFNSALYPSGLPKLVDTLADLGLALGLWMIRGIPKAAVDRRLPIYGTNYTAADIAVRAWACPWHSDVYGVNTSHPAGQAYYDSVVALYAAWGVKYLKVDCMFGARDMLNPGEIILLSNSVNKVAPTNIRIGLSPGVAATVKMATDYGKYVNGYRITDDLWDCWSPTTTCGCPDGINIAKVADALFAFQAYIGAPGLNGASFPDPDSLPLGLMRLGDTHMSALGRNQSEFVYAMWSITGGVFVLGGDLISTVQLPWLRALYTNPMLASMHLNTLQPHTVAYNSTTIIWASGHRSDASRMYVALFSYADDPTTTGGLTYTLSYDTIGVAPSTASVTIYDALAQKPVGTWHTGQPWAVFVSWNHVGVFELFLKSQ
jgi:alpha-galactosidase